MPDWPIHLIVPLLALLIVLGKEHQKYIFLLLPLAVMPDMDSFMTQHRALLHNIFVPLILIFFAFLLKEKRHVLVIASVYFASHVILDMFSGGVVLFYPFYERMAFIDSTLQISQARELIWTFDWGFNEYSVGWKKGYGYLSDSAGTGSFVFIFLAGVCVVYRNYIQRGIR